MFQSKFKFCFFLIVVSCSASQDEEYSYRKLLARKSLPGAENCDQLLDSDLKSLIASYQPKVNDIINFIVNGDFKGAVYKEVEDLVIDYPVRPSGSKSLEDSIDYMIQRMEHHNFSKVWGEQVSVPHWVRGEETATLLKPYEKSLPILGLGSSVGTSVNGITAPILVVKSFADLDRLNASVFGKIVVFNQGWINSYGETVEYRLNGATRASQYGAVATLIESIAPFSLQTPHTGLNIYGENATRIPVACITKEDADLLYRLQEKGNEVEINLKMLDYNLPTTTSRNVIGEITGSEIPSEIVAVSGHIDSWDVGQGAMDDAGGVMVSVMALAALKKMNLIPKRSLQGILWTAEEMDMWGVKGFVQQHLDILDKYSVAFESDFGVFKPLGLDFSGSETAGCIVNEVLKLMAPINATQYQRFEFVSSDITYLQKEGVPGLNLITENDKYFWYHHTEADTLVMINSTELDLNTALWAATAYVLADLPDMLPREETNL